MDINDDMVRRFFDRNCTAEEAGIVAAWLKQHPHAAEKYYKESDWNEETGEQIAATGWDDTWHQLRTRIRRGYIIRRMTYSLTACVALLLLFVWIKQPAHTPGLQLAALQSALNNDSAELKNDSDTSLQHRMPDGTIVSLLPHSLIRFSNAQWKTVREIQVYGEVVFKVAADQERPFIAYCDNLSIQAIGTIFSVRKHDNDIAVKVRLYEGKVLVQPVARNKAVITPVFARYLLPGQELIVPLNTYTPRQQNFLQGEKKGIFVKRKQQNNTSGIKPNGWYEFTSQPLEDVFTTLGVLYGVNIHYNKSTLENLYFIGRFEPTDAIEDVLGTIALLNNLKVIKRSDNNFYVTKKG